MKRLVQAFLIVFAYGSVAQPVTLLECYEAARNNSPYINQEENFSQIADLRIKSLSQGRLPQLFVNGQYTYQSEVIEFPDLPGLNFPEIPKNQYKLSVDLNQNLFGGNRINKSISIEKERLKLDQQNVKLKLSSIKNEVNKLYYSTLILQEKENLYGVIIDDMNNRMATIRSLVRNGVLRPGDEKSLVIEIKKATQEKTSLHYQKLAALKMLSDKTGLDLGIDTELVLPDMVLEDIEINRGEKKVLQYSRNALEAQKQLSNITRFPSIAAFGSVGIGDPNPLNFFETGTSSFYLLGLRLSWKIWDWNNASRSREILRLQQINLEQEEENFDQAISIQLAGANLNLEQLQNLRETDEEILELQSEITEESFARYKEGVITSSEYSRELNKEIQAKLKLAMREIEISRVIVNILTITGNI